MAAGDASHECLPPHLPPLPQSRPALHYERLAAEDGAVTPTFADADRVIRALWDRMFPLADGYPASASSVLSTGVGVEYGSALRREPLRHVDPPSSNKRPMPSTASSVFSARSDESDRESADPFPHVSEVRIRCTNLHLSAHPESLNPLVGPLSGSRSED